jgi:hypothetical protein
MSNQVVITDQLQTRYNWTEYALARDLVLFASVVFVYLNLPWDDFYWLLCLYGLFLIIRYLVSQVTRYHLTTTKKKYFQISGHFGLFLLIILFAQTRSLLGIQHTFVFITALFLFALLNILTRAHTTSDIMFTYLVTTLLFQKLPPSIREN